MRVSLFASLFAVSVQAAGVSITTGQYGNSRDNATTVETVLTQASVAASNFGKLGTFAVDGEVYAQPLIVSGSPNLLIVATMHCSVYAFNANIPNSAYVWKVSLCTPRTVYPGSTDPNSNNFYNHEIGILSTPVIDVSAGVIYVTAANSSNTCKLYALNLADGSTFHASVTIAGTSQSVTFDVSQHLQRTALALSAGHIYVGFGSMADITTYQGWLFAYSATDLSQTAVWLSNPGFVNPNGGGLWMGGGGPAIDGSGNVYVMTGNGTWDGTANYGESLVKLNSSLVVQDYFTPSNWSALNDADADFGSSHPVLFSTFVMGGGKGDPWFLFSQSSLGGLQGSGATITQTWSPEAGKLGNYGGVAYGNSTLYYAAKIGHIRAFAFNGSTFNTTAIATSTNTYSHPGAMMAYSSNADAAGTRLIHCTTDSANSGIIERAGTFRIFNADTLVELYNSGTNAADALGNLSKFAVPLVANGKIYVATLDNAVVMYGAILPSSQQRGIVSRRGAAVLR